MNLNKCQQQIQYDILAFQLENFLKYNFFKDISSEKYKLYQFNEIIFTFCKFIFLKENFKKFIYLIRYLRNNNSKNSLYNFLFLFFTCSNNIELSKYFESKLLLKLKDSKHMKFYYFYLIKYFILKLKYMQRKHFISYNEYLTILKEFFEMFSMINGFLSPYHLYLYFPDIINKLYKQYVPIYLRLFWRFKF